MNRETIDRLKELNAKRTQGEWKTNPHCRFVFGKSVGGCQMKEDEFMLMEARGWGHLSYLGEGKALEIQHANLAFIAALANHANELLESEAKREELAKEVEGLRAQLAQAAEREEKAFRAALRKGFGLGVIDERSRDGIEFDENKIWQEYQRKEGE